MKILLAHNLLRSTAPSGEAMAFDNDRRLLLQGGHEVICYTRDNDAISRSALSRADAALSLFWSRSAYRDIDALLARHSPDLAHFHNTFPLLSVSGYRACRARGVPVIQTLHNYRLLCPNGLLLRAGRPCTDCIDRSLLSAVRHACYRDSHVASGLVATMLTINRRRGVYARDVDGYLCLTESARQRFMLGGLPASRLYVRANALADPPAPGTGHGGFALYVGRLTPEKGVATLLAAWEGVDYPLRIVGDGALRPQLERQGQGLRGRISFEGLRARDEVLALMQAATLLVIPSECYEGFPVTVLEALACGTPLVVSAIGALDELVSAPDNGLKFEPGDAGGLRRAVLALLADAAARDAIRLRNRALFDGRYAPRTALEALENVYRRVVAAGSARARERPAMPRP